MAERGITAVVIKKVSAEVLTWLAGAALLVALEVAGILSPVSMTPVQAFKSGCQTWNPLFTGNPAVYVVFTAGVAVLGYYLRRQASASHRLTGEALVVVSGMSLFAILQIFDWALLPVMGDCTGVTPLFGMSGVIYPVLVAVAGWLAYLLRVA